MLVCHLTRCRVIVKRRVDDSAMLRAVRHNVATCEGGRVENNMDVGGVAHVNTSGGRRGVLRIAVEKMTTLPCRGRQNRNKKTGRVAELPELRTLCDTIRISAAPMPLNNEPGCKRDDQNDSDVC
jgi:hypothetical protein